MHWEVMMNDLKFTTAETYMSGNNMQSAFPDQYKDGMTLRDYFAAKAMAVLMTSAYNIPHAEVANKAYWFAEEMMKAREQE
jgi:hypothetical protein